MDMGLWYDTGRERCPPIWEHLRSLLELDGIGKLPVHFLGSSSLIPLPFYDHISQLLLWSKYLPRRILPFSDRDIWYTAKQTPCRDCIVKSRDLAIVTPYDRLGGSCLPYDDRLNIHRSTAIIWHDRYAIDWLSATSNVCKILVKSTQYSSFAIGNWCQQYQ